MIDWATNITVALMAISASVGVSWLAGRAFLQWAFSRRFARRGISWHGLRNKTSEVGVVLVDHVLGPGGFWRRATVWYLSSCELQWLGDIEPSSNRDGNAALLESVVNARVSYQDIHSFAYLVDAPKDIEDVGAIREHIPHLPVVNYNRLE